jgi:carboxyl-terminal processing protease
VTIRDDVVTIVAPLEDTPGSRAGLLAGDQIVAIEGEPTRGLNMQDVIRQLKGEPGTSVTITVHRPETDETRDYTVERAVIPLVSVKDAKVLKDTHIGYVRITQFSDPTAGEFREALEKLVSQEIESLIVDLRNNPGGLLDSAVDICGFFLKPKTLVVSTEGRRPSQKHEFRSGNGYKFPDLPVFILINGGSASAAEIMSGCLRDWKRATLVGEKTFGKGSVQNVIPLPDGSALRLTTAMYYTPTRRRIHKHGIEPDIEVKLTKDEMRRLFEAQNSVESAGRANVQEDRQLKRAVEALQSYSVYQAGRQKKFGELRENPDGRNPSTEKDQAETQDAQPENKPQPSDTPDADREKKDKPEPGEEE